MKRIIVLVIAGLILAYGILVALEVTLPVNLTFGVDLGTVGSRSIGLLAGVLALLIFMLAPSKPEKKTN
jgi:hypothetical protein